MAVVFWIVWVVMLAVPANADPPGTTATAENMQKLYGL
jgi:hypothetical protein